MSSQKIDYYTLLEVSRSATVDQIKKAYKKLAIKWHPDKNPDNKDEAVQRFRQISEAYEVLSNQQKRKKYDIYGFDGAKISSGTSSTRYNFNDANDLFKTFFSSYGFDNASDSSFFQTYLKAAFGMGLGNRGSGRGATYFTTSSRPSDGSSYTTYYTSSGASGPTSYTSKTGSATYDQIFNKYANASNNYGGTTGSSYRTSSGTSAYGGGTSAYGTGTTSYRGTSAYGTTGTSAYGTTGTSAYGATGTGTTGTSGTSSYGTSAYGSSGTSTSSPQKSADNEQLPPEGQTIKKVHHVTRKFANGTQQTIIRTTVISSDGSKQITQENMDGTNKKTYHVMGQGKKQQPKVYSNFSGYNFGKRQTSTTNDSESEQKKQQKSSSADNSGSNDSGASTSYGNSGTTGGSGTSYQTYYTTSNPSSSYTTGGYKIPNDMYANVKRAYSGGTKVYYADGTEAPSYGSSFGSSADLGSASTKVYYTVRR